MTTILERYEQVHPTSRKLFSQARQIFPAGVTHRMRLSQKPFPVFIDRANGSRKWDVDGNEYVDYVCGHGALLLGHGHPEVATAVTQQMTRGTHYGASHELEMAWGTWVKRLIPSAERVEFTSSGTEATLMALRIARAHTGRSKVLRFDDHFHGWHDYLIGERNSGAHTLVAPGVPAATLSTVLSIPDGDIHLLERTLAGDSDIAAVILEPTGAHSGGLPISPDFVRALPELTRRYGVVLIFDEVVTGFREAPGGAQEAYGVLPDLTTLAKILAGGLPGGAVAGKAEVMAVLEKKVLTHPGTFNANPLSAAAGVAALAIVARGEVHAQANAMAQRLRDGLGAVLRRLGVAGCVYGTTSNVKIVVDRECTTADEALDRQTLREGTEPDVRDALTRGLLNRGVFPAIGHVSGVHSERDIDETIRAFGETLADMIAEGFISQGALVRVQGADS